ncbi:MAG: RsmD family RNA methyltransferase, partial [Vicinamibacterales bacterium]
MRIVGGTFRGRTLAGPGRAPLRPTSDRLRETLFNILAPVIDDARVLDAYAGTGAVGLEALSRGAAHVTFVERDRGALAALDANIRALDVAP